MSALCALRPASDARVEAAVPLVRADDTLPATLRADESAGEMPSEPPAAALARRRVAADSRPGRVDRGGPSGSSAAGAAAPSCRGITQWMVDSGDNS